MLTLSSSTQLHENALNLLWSLWSELGVSSWTRRHAQWAVDPEPLILFTAGSIELDPRLRDESIDWCVHYGRYVSVTRLRNLLRVEPDERRSSFETFAATVNAHSDLRWPSRHEAREYRRTGRSTVSSFTPPALIALRLRALFGVGARADILRVFVAEPSHLFTSSDLVPYVNYTKRNMDKALDSLAIAGLLEVVAVRNQHRYRLRDPSRLLGFVGERPQVYPRWTPIFRWLAAVLDIASRADELEQMVQRVEVRRVFRQIEPYVAAAGLIAPPVEISGDGTWSNFLKWALDITNRLATGDASALVESAMC